MTGTALLAQIDFFGSYWGPTLIKGLVVALVIPTGALILGWTFLFKMMAHMQSRHGPMEAGPHGLLQLLAEGVKFLQKEDLHPEGADLRVFKFAPYVVLASTFLLYIVIPVGPDAIVEDLSTGIYFALAVSSLSVIGILMAGWGSANKYSLLGGLRAAGQLIAYELPMILAVVGVVIQAGTLSMQGIVLAQAEGSIFGIDALGSPFIITQFVGFAVFMSAIQAELSQPPFDMPVAESEIVGGYQVEYSGFRFLAFFMGEFGTAFAFAGIASVLFLGGWTIPFVDPASNVMNVLGPGVLLTKVMLVSFLIFWVRFTYPRFREDQLQKLAWKYLIPISLVNIVATGVLKVAF
jgi:NADH-quinone oxidoreductase subunit H